MKSMFENCHKLKSIDLSFLNGSSVIDMESILMNCYALPLINLTNYYEYLDLLRNDKMFFLRNQMITLK